MGTIWHMVTGQFELYQVHAAIVRSIQIPRRLGVFKSCCYLLPPSPSQPLLSWCRLLYLSVLAKQLQSILCSHLWLAPTHYATLEDLFTSPVADTPANTSFTLQRKYDTPRPVALVAREPCTIISSGRIPQTFHLKTSSSCCTRDSGSSAVHRDFANVPGFTHPPQCWTQT